MDACTLVSPAVAESLVNDGTGAPEAATSNGSFESTGCRWESDPASGSLVASAKTYKRGAEEAGKSFRDSSLGRNCSTSTGVLDDDPQACVEGSGGIGAIVVHKGAVVAVLEYTKPGASNGEARPSPLFQKLAEEALKGM